METVNIFIKSAFVDNMIFAYFLGMCSFLAVSKKLSTAFGLGIVLGEKGANCLDCRVIFVTYRNLLQVIR